MKQEQPFDTGETYDERCARLERKPHETTPEWFARIDADMLAWRERRKARDEARQDH